MAEQPRFFTVAPWGHRILTPWLASALPVRNIARAFRLLTFAALLAAGGLLFLYLRALGHGFPAAILGAFLFALLPPVAECLRYVFLAEPVAVMLQVALLLALQSGAGLGPLCLIAVLGTLAKEFFVLLVPVALVVGPRPMLPRAGKAAALLAVSLGTAAALRWWWTPHLSPPLPALSPGTFLLALHRFHDSFPEWWRAALLAGVALLLLAACESGPKLGPPVTVAAANAANPTLAVDPRNGVVYVAWVQTEADSGTSAFVIRRARDGSLGSAMRLNDRAGDVMLATQNPAQVVVGADGTPLLALEDQKGRTRVELTILFSSGPSFPS